MPLFCLRFFSPHRFFSSSRAPSPHPSIRTLTSCIRTMASSSSSIPPNKGSGGYGGSATFITGQQGKGDSSSSSSTMDDIRAHPAPAHTSGEHLPFWLTSAGDQLPKFPRLTENIRVDTCIVGAGIVGITTAYLLAKQGKTVCVLEDGEISSGETGRTTAHLAPCLDDRFYNLIKIHGLEYARQAYESHVTALDYIEQLCREEQIDCEFERLPEFLFKHEEEQNDMSEIEKELDAINQVGIPGVELINRAPIAAYDTKACISVARQGQFHPVKYMAGLTKAAVKAGARIHTNTHAQDFINDKNGSQIKTKEGYTVVCQSLVEATNTPITNRLTIHAKQEPHRSYVICALIPKKDFVKGLYWDTKDPYHYTRCTNYDQDHYLIITGGEDHQVGFVVEREKLEARYTHLHEWTRKRWPTVGPIMYKWSGQINETNDLLHFIGRNPGDYPHIYIATGDSGNGITGGTLAGMILSDMILGRKNKYEEVYDPSRIRIRAVSDMIQHDVMINAMYKDHLTPGDVSDIEDIRPCSGAVVRCGMHKVAVYKDESGGIHQMTALCPHLKGVVRWNDDEKSWDCPVHGSRFDKLGHVVTGPAKSNLDKTTYELPKRKP